jgi:hypothetical protein
MTASNPLAKHFRQPKLYFTLPSRGKYYPQGTIELPENGEIAVYPMTARDELIFKTPDALLNGQATVDVIQSCIPAIKDAWSMPTIDLDAVLIAIRIATYGQYLDVTAVVPEINESRDYTVDLVTIMNEITGNEFVDSLAVNDLTVHLKPLTYRTWTKGAIKSFEENRIFSTVNNTELSDQEKMEIFNASFGRLTDITLEFIVNSVVSVDADGETVDNPAFIREFVENADKQFVTAITQHIEAQKESFNIAPRTVATSEEDQAAGAPAQFSMPIAFDQSNFFG